MALLSASVWLAPAAQAADEFLDPEVAFKLSPRAANRERIELQFQVAPGYYLYGDKFSVRAEPAAPALGPLQAPKGKIKFDETFQKDVETFKDAVTLVQALPARDDVPFKLIVGNQGCADKGLCYPPMERAFKAEPDAAGWRFTLLSDAESVAWTPGAGAASAPTRSGATSALAAALTAPVPAKAEGPLPGVAGPPSASVQGLAGGEFAAALQSRSLWTVAGVFWLAGVLLAFTPCVLPMVPILSSIIVGQSAPVSRARGFGLALSYSLGMALVYTAFGMAAGLAGEGLAAALQNGWVLGGFALLLVALSLSMFGLYALQLPAALQSRLTQWSGRLQGGQAAGVFLMGGLSAIIVGPCVAAPLAGALVYISQTRDVMLGGVALFAMAAGMSLPLLLLGASAGSLLPRAGAWMERVKHVFGVLLLGVALWMVSPVVPNWLVMLGTAGLLLATAVYLGAFERQAGAPITPGRALTKGLGMLLAVLATLQLAGVASGGRDLLQPLKHLASGFAGAVGSKASIASSSLHFAPVTSQAELDAAVAGSSRPVMLDVYADWCVSCKELEALTFTDPAVRERLARMTLLRIDVTANDAEHKAVMRRLALFGPPALLFFNPGGSELSPARVIGFVTAAAFVAHLDGLNPLDKVLKAGMN